LVILAEIKDKMLITKPVYPVPEDKSEIMLKAKESLMKNMDSFILQPPEWKFLFQCAWIVGFREAQKIKLAIFGEEGLNETRSPDSSTT